MAAKTETIRARRPHRPGQHHQGVRQPAPARMLLAVESLVLTPPGPRHRPAAQSQNVAAAARRRTPGHRPCGPTTSTPTRPYWPSTTKMASNPIHPVGTWQADPDTLVRLSPPPLGSLSMYSRMELCSRPGRLLAGPRAHISQPETAKC